MRPFSVAGGDESPAAAKARELVAAFGEHARAVAASIFGELSVVEGAALRYTWSFWARPKQITPRTAWKRRGFLTGRGFGKTISNSCDINERIEASPTPLLILLMAQDEENSYDVQVGGPSGLIATAPPWNKPEWIETETCLVWPNGSRAYVRTPENPGKIRGLEYHIAWLCELQSWPLALREEAWSNALISTRLGDAQVYWDATPKRGHPILKRLLAENELEPERYLVTRGSTHENASNLGPGYVEDLEKQYGGTSKGREELLGEMLEESENAIVRALWIEKARRPRPDTFVRRAIGIDPAVTDRKGSDTTGVVGAGVGIDGQCYVLRDMSGKHAPHAWAELVLDWYVNERADVVVVETNKGGALVTQNLRAAATAKGLSVVVLGPKERPQHAPKVVYVREVHARGSKVDRAQPVATAYERGRVSHTRGVPLDALEETLTTWEPTPNADSPGDLDALVHVVIELLRLNDGRVDPSVSFAGLERVGAALSRPAPAPPVPLAALLQGLQRPRI